MELDVSRSLASKGQTRLSAWIPLALLGFILAAGAYLRVEGLDARTMGHMEIYVPNIELPYDLSDPRPRLSLVKTLSGTLWESHPPAWYAVMYFWTELFGTSLTAIRLPSVLFALGSIALVNELGRQDSGPVTGLLAAGLLSLNGMNILWSQIARPTLMAMFLGLMSTVLLIRLLRESRRPGILLGGYLLVTLLGMATLYYYWPIFAGQLLWVAVGRSREGTQLGLVKWQLLVLIVASPFISVAIFQSGPAFSYLGSNPVKFVLGYLQFGFLFEADLDGPGLPSAWLTISATVLGGSLLLLGLARRPAARADLRTLPVSGPKWSHMAIASAVVWLTAGVFVFAALRKVETQIDPHSLSIAARAPLLIASTFSPWIFLLSAIVIERLFRSRARELVARSNWFSHDWNTASLITTLALVPFLLMVMVNAAVPILASRHLLLFTPFLIGVVSRGAAGFLKRPGRALGVSAFSLIVAVLAPIHLIGIEYNQRRPISPNDYQGLVEQWQPAIAEGDLIIVERHWVTTPLFYYLPAQRYRFVGADYATALAENDSLRAWVVRFPGLPLIQELEEALEPYRPEERFQARRIEVHLYVRDQTSLEEPSTEVVGNPASAVASIDPWDE